MEPVQISNKDEYFAAEAEGFSVLLDDRFNIDISLRKQLQDEIFGEDGSDPKCRERFFRWIWERKMHVCEETGAFIGHVYRAEFMSHILSRGAFIEMWNDPRNINLLSPAAHREWETGKKEKMRIWPKNKDLIAKLKAEYSGLKKYNKFPEAQRSDSSDEIKNIMWEAYSAGNRCENFEQWWELSGVRITKRLRTTN